MSTRTWPYTYERDPLVHYHGDYPTAHGYHVPNYNVGPQWPGGNQIYDYLTADSTDYLCIDRHRGKSHYAYSYKENDRDTSNPRNFNADEWDAAMGLMHMWHRPIEFNGAEGWRRY